MSNEIELKAQIEILEWAATDGLCFDYKLQVQKLRRKKTELEKRLQILENGDKENELP